MRRTILIAGLFLISVDTIPASAETKNIRNYGVCQVFTVLNDFTDKLEYHALVCAGKGVSRQSLGYYYFAISCGEQRSKNPYAAAGNPMAIVFGAGFQSHFEQKIIVRYRWGKNKAYKESWSWNRKLAINRDPKLINLFFNGMMSTNRLIFQVGEKKGVVKITEAERAAIPDFNTRCSK